MNDNNKSVNKYAQLVSGVQGYFNCVAEEENCCKYRTEEEAWVNCYREFNKNSKSSEEDLAKSLDHYLRAWGMYRNSFINNNPRVHLSVIRILCNGNYWDLKGINCSGVIANKDKIKNLINVVSVEYIKQRSIVKHNKIDSPISPILVSKVLLGTLGCVPAYDSNFTKGLEACGIRPKTFGINSVVAVAEAFMDYESELVSLGMDNEYAGTEFFSYPCMKIIDSGLWYIGKESESLSKYKND